MIVCFCCVSTEKKIILSTEQCIVHTDCTFYWKMLAWRWCRKDQYMQPYWVLMIVCFCCVSTEKKLYCVQNNTELFISPWNILKIHNKYTTQRIMVILTPIERETLQVFFTCSGLAGAQLVSFSNPIHSFFAWSWTSRPRSYAQTAFIPEFRIPLLDTVENRCCILEFCSKSSLHSHNGRGSCVFQNTKWLLKFTERHICY